MNVSVPAIEGPRATTQAPVSVAKSIIYKIIENIKQHSKFQPNDYITISMQHPYHVNLRDDNVRSYNYYFHC
jgi:hypothetical protein